MSLAAIDPHGVLDRLKAGEPIKLLRQSNIGSGDICLRRAGYDMRPDTPRHSGEARCVGTAYHAGLEWYYRCRVKTDHGEDPFPPVFSECVDAARKAFEAEGELFSTWATSREEAWARVEEMLRNYLVDYHCTWPMDHEILGVEQEWFLPLSGQWHLKGSIDLVVRRPDGTIVLDDHKTAGRKWPKDKHKPEKQNQAVIYSWAWWLGGQGGQGPLPEFAFSIMTYKGEFDRRVSVIEPRHVQAVLQKAVGMSMVFDKVPLEWLPTNTSSNLCSVNYCDYFAECPSGLALAPAIDGSPVALAVQGGASDTTTTDEETAA